MKPVALRCDNPECDGILDSDVMYEPTHGRVYHVGECQLLGLAHLAWDSEDMIFGNFEKISLEKALGLYHKGKLKQAASASDSPSQA